MYRLGFGRPSLCGSLDELAQQGSDPTEQAFNAAALCSPLTAAGGVPGNRGFGNLGRNVLRASYQKRLDLMLAKSFTFGSRMLEVRWDVFNVLNWVNFAVPNNVIGDAGTDSGSTSASNRYSQRPTIRSVFERDPHPETAPRFNPDRSQTRVALHLGSRSPKLVLQRR